MEKKDIRALFLDFFAKKGHRIYDSMPLVPNDASLLFTNAGMVQFKDIFTGKIPAPEIPCATSSQLCMRAGGKHNDLENVGYTARHHTLFEMLGNFSFGDYFKKDAIAYAWEFVTEILGFDKSLLYVSIHESDEEAYKIWCQYIDKEHIKRMGDKDNFWQMGDSGPCGPCSEIYVDQGAEFFKDKEDYFGGEGDRFLEIWNLVFMQYEQKDGIRKPLPKPSIDTGMGLERVVALLEGKINNFDTSLFAPLMQTIEKLTGSTYYHDDELKNARSKKDVPNIKESENELKKIQASFRVIADHARSVCFLLAQGVNFDKEGRGYVLRRILRRAVRHGYLLGLRKPFLYQVIATVCDSMGGHYQYLKERKNAIMEQCKNEELRFFETIENGMTLFNKELESTKGSIFDGSVAFKLYDTYGFPLDLTQDMLREHQIGVDIATFESCMNEQKAKAKASWKGSGDGIKEGDFKALLAEFGESTFTGYHTMQESCEILALLDSNFKRTDSLRESEMGYVMLNKTPFYPESGGPIGDRGVLIEFSKDLQPHGDSYKRETSDKICAKVLDTQKYFNLNLSKIQALKPLHIGDKLLAIVDPLRLEIIKHHSATHLLHYALRTILGNHIAQAGSLVESTRLRFDFSHPKSLSLQELEEVESFVNAQIALGTTQICETMNIKEAKKKGAMALFGEKYGENVRVITFGDSIELCGGIHVKNTAEIGSFYITKESSVSSGVRRIEAVCGQAAYQYGKNALNTLKCAKESLKSQDILQGIDKLKTQLNEMRTKSNQNKNHTKDLESEQIGQTKLIVAKLDSTDITEAKQIVDNAKNKEFHLAILLILANDDKVSIIAGVKDAPLRAGIWVKEVAQVLGGNGGGRDDFATAGGKDTNKTTNTTNKNKTTN